MSKWIKSLTLSSVTINPTMRLSNFREIKFSSQSGLTILALLSLVDTAHASCDGSAQQKAKFTIQKSTPIEFACRGYMGKPTGKRIGTSFCTLELKNYDTGKKVKAIARAELCALTETTPIDLSLDSSCCDVLSSENCTANGKPKNPKALENIWQLACDSGTNWIAAKSE